MCEGLLPMDPLREIIAERARAEVRVRVRVSIGQPIPLLRRDQSMLVWLRYAVPALENFGPVLRLTRSAKGGTFDAYADIFEVSTRRAG